MSMSREPGKESFFCALRPILRILSLERDRRARQAGAGAIFVKLLSIAAAFILRYLTNLAALRRGAIPIPHVPDGKAVVFELILTFFLVWAVWATAVDPRGAFPIIAGLAIGLTITIDIFSGCVLLLVPFERGIEGGSPGPGSGSSGGFGDFGGAFGMGTPPG